MILTVKELAKYLRVNTTTVYRLMSTRQIPGFRVGSDWRFDLDAIDRWCSEGEQAAVSSSPAPAADEGGAPGPGFSGLLVDARFVRREGQGTQSGLRSPCRGLNRYENAGSGVLIRSENS